MKKIKLLIYISLLNNVGFASNLAMKPEEKAKVLIEEMKSVDDKKRIIVPVKVEAKIQSLVSAETEGNVIKILKPLGAKLSAGEIVLYIENRDPSFTFAKVPVRTPLSGVLGQVWINQMAKVNRGDKLFSVIDPKFLKLTAEIPSGELSFIKSGLKGQFSIDSKS